MPQRLRESYRAFRQPPCEAVSWNEKQKLYEQYGIGSASLWGCELKYKYDSEAIKESEVSLLVRLWVEMRSNDLITPISYRQPPCEAVSWNSSRAAFPFQTYPSASLWGCELKCLEVVVFVSVVYVSLLVRLWVEMRYELTLIPALLVSLLVRLWVEMQTCVVLTHRTLSASLWGCELKSQYTHTTTTVYCQPPCEAVSWNRFMKINATISIRQPPCEAVSWNNIIPGCTEYDEESASLWGCELK